MFTVNCLTKEYGEHLIYALYHYYEQCIKIVRSDEIGRRQDTENDL